MDKKKNKENDIEKVFGMNRMMFFIIIILICVLALSIGIYATFFYRYSKKDPFMLGVGIKNSQEEEEISNLRTNFPNIFKNNANNIEGTTTVQNIKRLDNSKDALVYTISDITKQDDNYSVNVKIPKINISSSNTDKINAEINRNFSEKAKNIMDSNNNNVHYDYNVTYKAYLNGSVLSLIINETEHGSEPQTTRIYTYNINLHDSTSVSVSDILLAKNYSLQEVQTEIDDEIKELNKKDEDLKKNYSNIKIRDTNNPMYKLENTTNFMVNSDGYVYIIYAYGNNEKTTKMDVLIFK